MFKPSPRLCGRLRRLPLTTKQTNKGYYKGSGTGLLGTIDRKGHFKFDLDKVRTFVVPRELDTTKLTPFITRRDVQNQPVGEEYWEAPLERLDGAAYLAEFKTRGNHEEHQVLQEEAARMRMLRGEHEEVQEVFEPEKEWEKLPERQTDTEGTKSR